MPAGYSSEGASIKMKKKLILIVVTDMEMFLPWTLFTIYLIFISWTGIKLFKLLFSSFSLNNWIFSPWKVININKTFSTRANWSSHVSPAVASLIMRVRFLSQHGGFQSESHWRENHLQYAHFVYKYGIQ